MKVQLLASIHTAIQPGNLQARDQSFPIRYHPMTTHTQQNRLFRKDRLASTCNSNYTTATPDGREKINKQDCANTSLQQKGYGRKGGNAITLLPNDLTSK
ncbi:hypothetical protein ISCGN_032289 [Ixodes scapularis]